MPSPLIINLVERFEALVHRLPLSLQKPITNELTPLKELFLRARPPRFLLAGSPKLAANDFVEALFGSPKEETARGVLFELYRWHDLETRGNGRIQLLDARGADSSALERIGQEMGATPPDIMLFLHDPGSKEKNLQNQGELAEDLLRRAGTHAPMAKVIAIVLRPFPQTASRNGESQKPAARERLEKLFGQTSLLRERFLGVADESLPIGLEHEGSVAARRLMLLLTRILPAEGRVEMARISGDRDTQREVALPLIKSAVAICSAVGAQPIPLADLPILTTLQLMMVSGIMHLSGRERNARAAGEFLGALGVNLGAGMLLRESARAALKFFPGWGNVICGMVAGAGTYAIGRASMAYFIEGFSLKDTKELFSSLSRRPRLGRKRPATPEETVPRLVGGSASGRSE